jgi:HK97 family phage major capsid protein
MRNRTSKSERIGELREQQAKLIEASQAILTQADIEQKRDLTPAEVKVIDENMGQVDELGVEIAELDGSTLAMATAIADQLKAHLATPKGRKTQPDPVGSPIDGSASAELRPQGGGIGRALYAQMFPAIAARGGLGGFKDAAEVWRTLISGRGDARFDAMRAMYNAGAKEVPGDSGGFAVPPAFSSRLLDLALETDFFRALADVVPAVPQSITFPLWDDSNHQNTAGVAGLGPTWRGESELIPSSTPKLRRVTMVLRKLALMIACSNELLEDAGGDFVPRLEAAMARNIGFTMLFQWLNGSGAGVPMGVRSAPATVNVTRTANTGVGGVAVGDVTGMFARLNPAVAERAIWIAHPTNLPSLLGMANSTAATATPVYLPNNNVAGSPSGTLLGRPIRYTEVVPHASSTEHGSLILGAPSEYLIALGPDIRIERSFDAGFQTDETWIRGKTRIDGIPKRDAAITPTWGSQTLGDFVMLSQRST